MAKKADKAGEVLASRKNELSVVAQDRNWRTYVKNELASADQWSAEWGFLSATSDGKCLQTAQLFSFYPFDFMDKAGCFSQLWHPAVSFKLCVWD